MKNKSVLISVLMPAYNAEKYIGKAIKSILNQTITNFELIITNDGSTDKTEQIIQDFAWNSLNLNETKPPPYTMFPRPIFR